MAKILGFDGCEKYDLLNIEADDINNPVLNVVMESLVKAVPGVKFTWGDGNYFNIWIPKVNKWRLICSTDGNMVDYDEIIESEEEPGFWECYEIAEAHGCEHFMIDKETPIID